MNFDLKELGITFIVGSFVILGLEAVLFYFYNIQLTGFFQTKAGLDGGKPSKTDDPQEMDYPADSSESQRYKDNSPVQTIKIAIFIGIAFAVGILAEGLSYKYVDSVQTPFKELPSFFKEILPKELDKSLGLPSKENSRIKTLIKNIYEKPEVEPLANDLAKQKAFSLMNPSTGLKVENWIKDPNRCAPDSNDILSNCPSISEITQCVYGVYYYAKNRVYQNPSYYDEMRRIESRRDFSRSISLIAFVYLMGAVFTGLARLIYLMIKFKGGSFRAKRTWEICTKMVYVSLILFGIYFFSMWAYERESDEFNKRAFGYFSTMLIQEQNSPSQSKIKAEEK
jgi:hypothetical protein